MVHLEKITPKNYEDVTELNIFESQYPFVADNTESLAEAYLAVMSGEAYAYPFAIYDDETLVGFLMIGYNEAALDGPDAPASLKDNYSLWRLLIDKRYQKKGFGREAVRLALEFVKTWPRGEAEYCVTSYNPDNEVAKKLYASFGFVENGEMDEDEIVAVLKLRDDAEEGEKEAPTVLELEDSSKVEALFAGTEDPMILSCLQGMMDGKIYVTDPETPRSAMTCLAEFAYFAGEPDRELAAFKPEGYVGMVPPDEGWAALIEDCWPDADKVTRYFIRKDTRFDREKLEGIVAALPADYELRRIDGELYDALLESEQFKDNVCHFASKEQYLELGRGFAVLKDGVPVSVASSYIVYRGGIDIQIDTEEEYRRKGLATAAGAALILSCLDDGLYPSWDAANLESVHLAEKLGYELSYEYPCYWLDELLDRVIPDPDKSGWDALCGRWERQTEDRKVFEVLRKGEDLYVKFMSRKGEPLELKLFPVGENSFGLLWSDDEIVFKEGGMTVNGQSCKKL